jgi:hypothetical protein
MYMYTQAASVEACQTATDFDFYPRFPFMVQAPVYLCLKISDRAGNESGIFTRLIE